MKGILLFISTAAFAIAQSSARPNREIRVPNAGRVTAEVDLEPVISLDQLIRSADLIVDGTILTVLPSINRNPAHPVSIETPILVAITGVSFGSVAAGSTISITQEGGKAGELQVVVPQDTLPQTGERYILFLHCDTRTVPPNTTGYQRFYPVGLWSGKARVQNGRISFLPAAVPRLHQLDNTEVGTFLASLQDRINLLRPGAKSKYG